MSAPWGQSKISQWKDMMWKSIKCPAQICGKHLVINKHTQALHTHTNTHTHCLDHKEKGFRLQEPQSLSCQTSERPKFLCNPANLLGSLQWPERAISLQILLNSQAILSGATWRIKKKDFTSSQIKFHRCSGDTSPSAELTGPAV